jgi:stage V sporulation protein B
MLALARPVLVFLYGSAWGGSSFIWNGRELWAIDVAANGLRILSLGIMFISLLSTTNSLLPAVKKSLLTTVSVFSGVAALAVTEIALIRVPFIGIYGAPVASVVCYAVALFMNMRFLRKLGYIRSSFMKMFAVPLICSLICGIISLATVIIFSSFINADRRFGAFAVMCIGGIAGVVSYVFTLLMFGGITAEEIRLLPKGNKLCDFLIKKGWVAQKR